MPPSARFSFCLLAALFVSLGIKAAMFNVNLAPDDHRLASDVAAALAPQGFRGNIEPRPANSAIVRLDRGSCQLWARDASAFGQDMIANNRAMLGAAGPLHYAYRGRYIDSYPRVRSEIDWRIQRELGRLNIFWPINPVIAVAARPECLPPPSIFAKLRLHLR